MNMEHGFTQAGKLLCDVGEIGAAVIHVRVEAAVGLRHNNCCMKRLAVALQGSVPMPHRVVVGAAVKQVENRRSRDWE